MGDVEQGTDSARSVWPLGKYLILAELGRGGMAEVYLALARGPNGFSKMVVLKLLRTHLAEDEEFLEMFLAEARLAARLNHPNIVQTYEVGTEGGRQCIVMEYLEGRSLAELEKATRSSGMPIMLSVRALADTLAGLHHAHELQDIEGKPLGLVHRDVSPHNVFVTYEGQVKVLDFGIAKATDSAARTKTGVFKGKVRYTAPERFTGEDADRRSDLFSVGVMLWEALTGTRIWSGLGDLAIMHQLASGALIPRPSTLNPAVAPRLDEICMRALAHVPAHRFQTAAEFQDALEEFLASESGTSNRVLGKFMAETFAEARTQFSRAVDDQMRVAASIPPSQFLSSISRLKVEQVPVLGVPSSGSGSISISGDVAGAASMARVKSGTLTSTLSSYAPHMRSLSPDLTARPKKRAAIVLGLIAFAAILSVLFFMGRSHRGPEGNSERNTAAQPAEVPANLGPNPASVASAIAAPSVTSNNATDPGAQGQDADASASKHPRAATQQAAPVYSPRAAPQYHPKAAPPPEPARSAVATPKADPPKREIDCTSPYFVDEQGTKKIRPECL